MRFCVGKSTFAPLGVRADTRNQPTFWTVLELFLKVAVAVYSELPVFVTDMPGFNRITSVLGMIERARTMEPLEAAGSV